MDLTRAKAAAGKAGAELVQEGMIVGLGTGSTAAYFIKFLGERCQKGLNISAVSTSSASMELAMLNGIPIIDIDSIVQIDLTVDGADEVDQKKRMIKGGGGAHLREKIVASMSKEMVVIIDSTKLVTSLGKAPLPLEICPFAYPGTIHRLELKGYFGQLRRQKNGDLFITESGHYIFDIHFSELCKNPEKVDMELKNIPGVLETGFFLNIAGRVVVGYEDGHFEIHP